MGHSSLPWRDWIPGVLSREQLRILCKKQYITNSDEEPDFSSIDLSISDACYVMRKGSVIALYPFIIHAVEQAPGDRGQHTAQLAGIIRH